MKKQLFRFLCCVCVLALLCSLPVSAAGTNSFSRWETNDEIVTTAGRPMYTAVEKVDGPSLDAQGDLAIGSLKGISDVCCADGFVYLLSQEQSRIFVLDEDLKPVREIVLTDSGVKVNFNFAEGIYVEGEDLFLMDTLGGQVLQADLNGVVNRKIELPEDEIIPDDMEGMFQPVSMVRDPDGNYYVVSKECYYGAFLFDSDFNFLGFFGANAVKATALDTLAYIWDLMTNTDEKRAKQDRTLPYAFNDIAIDKKGYLYTCNGATEKFTNGTGQIQQLSPGGVNVLQKRENTGKSGSSSGYAFLERQVNSTYKERLIQNFSSLEISDSGLIFALDDTYGLVYVYDTDCNMITAFGGGCEEGDRLGLFHTATSVTLMGNRVLIADSEYGSITVFEQTEYGAVVDQAQQLYLAGNYPETEKLWQKALSMDSAGVYAYRGLAKVSYAKGDYQAALRYAEQAYDYVTYDAAYKQVRDSFVEKYFAVLFPVAVLLVAALFFVLIRLKKRETPLVANVRVRTMLNTSVHPFDTFKDIKYKNFGSLPLAILLIVLFTLTSVLRMTGTSFLFRTADVYNYNALYTLASTAGLVLLWSVSNWLISTLMSGKGTLKEIVVSTAYCLTPMIVINLVVTLLSYCLSYDDAALITGLITAAVIFTLYLLIVAVMTIHDYTFGKFLLSTLVTLFLMILVVFILFMVVIMLQQFWNFIYTVYMEVAYR